MEWLDSIQKTIHYIEEHITDSCSIDDLAKEIYISPFYLQKGFKMLTGYTISEYIRCRRLYLAALDAISSDIKVIDLAYRYGYDTPESFTKAFTRFHGVSPIQIRKQVRQIKVFLPLKIKISIQGGNDMNFVVEKLKKFQVIGFEKYFSFDNSYEEIPKFWSEICHNYLEPLYEQKTPESDIEKAIVENKIGMFGVCVDNDCESGKFRYIVGGPYNGGKVPEGLCVVEFPDLDWAKFKCVGPMPGALQSVNTQVFREWLPNNPEYDISFGANIEWYSEGDGSALDYESEIWVPVKRK